MKRIIQPITKKCLSTAYPRGRQFFAACRRSFCFLQHNLQYKPVAKAMSRWGGGRHVIDLGVFAGAWCDLLPRVGHLGASRPMREEN